MSFEEVKAALIAELAAEQESLRANFTIATHLERAARPEPVEPPRGRRAGYLHDAI